MFGGTDELLTEINALRTSDERRRSWELPDSTPSILTHNLLSATHPDTVAAAPVQGDLVVANSTPAWQRLALGATGRIPQSDGSDLVYVAISGDATLAAGGALTLADTAVTAGTYGSATQAPRITVDSKGRITAAVNVTITPAASSITGGAALTKVDDTNVTLTLGGSPASALLAATSITVGWSGQLAVGRGGTGTGTAFTAGSVIFAGASGVYSQNNPNFFWDDSNNRHGIGTATPATTLDIVSTTEQIRAGYDASNYASFTVSSAGALTIAPTGTGGTNITGTLNVSGHAAFGGGQVPVASIVLRTVETFNNPSSTNTGISSVITYSLTANNSNILSGITSTPTINQGGFNATSTYGTRALQGIPTVSGSSGVVSGVVGLFTRPNLLSTGTVSSAFGVVAFDPSNPGAGTYTSVCGVNVTDHAAGTNNTNLLLGASVIPSGNWSIYNASTYNNYLAGMLGIGQAGISARLHVTEATLGNEVFRIESTATNDDPADKIFQNRVATTDATQTTLHTIAIPASTTVKITAYVRARRTAGSAGTAEDAAGYVVVGTYKNVAGTATLVGAVNVLYTAEDQAGWDATLDVNAGNARVRVTGATNNTVTWHCTVKVEPVGS